MNKRDMTFEHMVDVAEACQACENLQSVHAILHAAGQTEEEIDTMWSRREDCWWSHNFGGMNSRQAVIRGWANGLANNSKFWYSLLVKTYPEVEGMDPSPDMLAMVAEAYDRRIFHVRRALYLLRQKLEQRDPQAAERRGEGLYRFLGWLFQEVEKKALPGDENRCKIEENT